MMDVHCVKIIIFLIFKQICANQNVKILFKNLIDKFVNKLFKIVILVSLIEITIFNVLIVMVMLIQSYIKNVVKFLIVNNVQIL